MTEDWLEKAIRAAVDRGDFDELPGSGRPIDGLGQTYDPAWWAKRFVSREKAREAGIEIVAEISRSLPSLLAASELDDVLARVDGWNRAIDNVNQHVEHTDRIHNLDRGDVERRWRQLRA